MSDEYIHTILSFKKKFEPFASVTVISRKEPSSGKVGDKALVNQHGKIFGWIGGGCVQSIVCKEAVDAIQSSQARRVIIGLSNDQNTISSHSDIKTYKMTCQSEGSVEVFIEPYVPVQHLVIIGKTVIAKAMSRLAKASGYRVSVLATDTSLESFGQADELFNTYDLKLTHITAGSAILIATQGESDELALEQALKEDVAYIGFVASRKKKETVFSYLLDSGIPRERLDQVFSPAGIDINAKKPEEVAISILAQIIQVKSGQSYESAKTNKAQVLVQYYINPVCGVPVDKNNPKHVIEYQGEKVYFCCDGCKVSFEKEPAKYITQPTSHKKG
jgi:xanthine dehydrogenase accessory factor